LSSCWPAGIVPALSLHDALPIATARGLNMVLQHLCPCSGPVFVPKCLGPYPSGDPSDDGVFGIYPIGEEKGEVGTELVNVHPPGDRKSTRLNSSHVKISYAVFCL